MPEETLSDSYTTAPSAQPTRGRLALSVVMQASDLQVAASRHLLDDIDVVVFGRGEPNISRNTHQGQRRLVLRMPDPMQSSDHGRLLHVNGRWMMDDPRSRNGSVVAGTPTRCAPVVAGDLVEIGHTLMLFDTCDLRADTPLDVRLSDDPLASFHDELATASDQLEKIAASDIPVLLHGETGTGKEVYARRLHELSKRRGPFVAVNCGALSPSLLEAELFGHRKGSFSGATADRPGFVRTAHGGTLFLDEIGELSPAGQVALLRVLQEHEVIPVGDSQPIVVDVRVCAATHRRLLAEVDGGRFRSDLYARLLGFELGLPPLRARRADLGRLCAILLARITPGCNTKLTPGAARGVICYDWPRNIRELERTLATAVVLAGNDPIDLPHLPEAVRHAATGGHVAREQPAVAPSGDGSAVAVDDDDPIRAVLAAKLVEHNGNISAVARDLGKHREQIQRWIKRYGIDIERFRR